MRRARRFIGSGFLVLAGISPFVVYVGLKVASKEAVPAWPSGVALATANGGELSSFSLLHFGSSEPTIMRFPAETALEAPGTGTLRAASAYRIGGASLMARALADTVGLRIPYFAEWRNTYSTPGVAPSRSNLGLHVTEVTRVLGASSARIVAAPGEFKDRFAVRYFTLDLIALRQALSGTFTVPSTSPATTRPSASASPSSTLAGISVEVLNQGGERGAAADLAQRLQRAGFVDVRTGNGSGRSVNGLVVYYADKRSDAEAVAEALDERNTEIARLPSSLDTTADVLVLVGRNAGTSTSRRSTPASNPTGVVTVS